MRVGIAAALAALALAAQEPPAMRGVLLDWDHKASGQIMLRGPGDHVHLFGFDGRTLIERNGQRQLMSDLVKGETLEIVSDPDGNRPPYARVVRVVTSVPAPPKPLLPHRHWLYRTDYTPSFDDLFPRGDLTFSGLVSKVEADRLVLHTAHDTSTTVLLRSDTRYMSAGHLVTHAALRVNTHVFIRGSRNFDNQLEAYSVVWGAILRPR